MFVPIALLWTQACTFGLLPENRKANHEVIVVLQSNLLYSACLVHVVLQ